MVQLFAEQRNPIYPEIPNEYVVLEYIQSSGTQYINSGLSMPNGFHLKSKVVFNVKTTQNIFGAYGPTAPYYRNFIDVTVAGNWLIGYGNDSYQYFSSFSTNTEYVVDVNNIVGKQSLNINGTSYTVSSTGTPGTKTDIELYIMAMNAGGSIANYMNGKMYYLKIYNENEVLVRDLIPVKNTLTNEVGMYDLVQRKFYVNSGTGAFTAGPEIKAIEYIESSGTQYIDTGLEGNENTKIEVKYAFTRVDGVYALFGDASDDNSNAFFVRSNNAHTATYANFDNVARTVVQAGLYDTNTHTTTLSKNGWYIDNDLYATWSNTTSFTTPDNLLLFAYYSHNVSTGFKYSYSKIYYCKIYDNNSLVRNFIPIKYGTTYGMLDLINHTVYTNSGTGSFTGGTELTPVCKLSVGYSENRSSDFEELSWIESNGTQYIDTGYKATTRNLIYKVKVNKNIINDSENDIIGWYTSQTGTVVGIYTKKVFQGSYTSSGSDTNIYSSQYSGDTTLSITAEYNGTANTKTLYINDDAGITLDYTKNVIEITSDILLFAGNIAQSTYKFTGKIYYAKIYDNGTLVRDFIPVRKKSTNEIGMYDKVNSVFYTNAGTGTFTAGPTKYNFRVAYSNKLTKLPVGYTSCEYIQSSGTQYIDTGYYPTNNTRFKAGVNPLFNTTTTPSEIKSLFGVFSNSNFRLGINSYASTDNKKFQFYYFNSSGSNNNYNAYLNSYARNDIEFMGSEYTANGTTLTISAAKTLTSAHTLVLFGDNNLGTISCAPVIIYYFQLYEGTTLVRNLIPCLNTTTNKYGLYDLVNNVFYGNSGTGNFVGPS